MEKILLVEDSKSFSTILSNSITQRWKVEVECADTLEEARALLQGSDGQFALAIVDLNLPDAPDGSAVDVVLSHHVPSIVFTAQLNDQLRETMLAKGVADYVLKQGAYNIDYVVNMVGRLLKNREITTLVLSSDESKRRQIGEWLKGQKLRVLECSKGLEALARLQQEKSIRVMIVDFSLDDIDSYSFVAKARETHDVENLIIIGLSNIQERSISVHFIKSGANDVLIYPFLPEELNCRVNRSLDQMEHFHKLIELNLHKNRLMGMAAHDIRGPVGVMTSAFKKLQTNELKPERRTALSEMFQRASTDLLRLLNDLLDVSAIESGRLQLSCDLLNVRELMVNRVRAYEGIAEQKDIAFNTRFKACPDVMGDANRLAQVVDNLISNAIKFSVRGSQVDITLEQLEGFLRVAVTDYGMGVPAAERELLFKPFCTLSSKPTEGETSTGLGLAICKNIVNQHGGEIGLDQTRAQGCTFFFTLPI